MRPRPIFILAALDFEARPIARALRLRFVSKTLAVGETTARGRIRLCTIGPGARRLPDASAIEPDCIVVMAGLAGGLADDLSRGDLVVDDQGEPVPGLPARRGPIATVQQLAATPADKRRLREATGALVVDMENALARDWARQSGLAFIGLRVVSDTSTETLDPATLRIMNAYGRLSPAKLIRELWRRPAFAVSLWRMRDTGKQVRTLARALADWTSAVSLNPTPVPTPFQNS